MRYIFYLILYLVLLGCNPAPNDSSSGNPAAVSFTSPIDHETVSGITLVQIEGESLASYYRFDYYLDEILLESTNTPNSFDFYTRGYENRTYYLKVEAHSTRIIQKDSIEIVIENQDAEFQFPLENVVVEQVFGNRQPTRYHAGEDLAGGPGTPVYAIADGIITYSGPMYGYGWLVSIDHHKPDVYSLYGHLSTRRWKKPEGIVSKGELIAYLADDDEDGSDGMNYVFGPHLHYGIRPGSRFDYPHTAEDNRWMAGLTLTNPADLGWLNPSLFISNHK